MNKKYFLIFTLIALLLTAQWLLASGPKVGTNGAAELLIPMGARNVALGGANIASIKGTEAIYWNPAGLTMMSKASEATFSYLDYFADIKVSYLAAGTQIGNFGTLGLSLQSLNVGEIDVTTVEAPEGTGATIQPDFLTLNATFSKKFTDRINFGANFKVISQSVGNMHGSAMAFDFGLQYVTPWNMAFGVVMRNLGSSIKFDGTGIEFDSEIPYANPNATSRKTKLDMASNDLPASLNLGVAYSYVLGASQKLNVSGIYANNSFAIDHVSGGLEYAFKDLVFLRGGYSALLFPEDYPSGLDSESQFGLTFGVGCNIPLGTTTMMLDYAYRDMKLFDANQYFSVGFSF